MGLSLKDIQSRLIEVSISSPDGYNETVTVGTLSYTEWNNCSIGVDFPSAPVIRMMTDKGMQDVFNYNDPNYRNDLARSESQVAFRRVVKSMLKGGNFAEIANDDFESQCESLADLDATIVQGVMQWLSQQQRHTKGGVEAKKATFPDSALPEHA